MRKYNDWIADTFLANTLLELNSLNYGELPTERELTKKETSCRVDLPGYSRKDVEVSVFECDRMIQIVADNTERGRTVRKVSVPTYLDINNVEAAMENGLLELSFGTIKTSRKLEIK